MHLPEVKGPADLPELRMWLHKKFSPGGSLETMDGRFVARTLQTAKLWWVEPETCDLIAESAPTWPKDAEFDIHSIPVTAGFAVLATDILGTDSAPVAEGKQVRISALAWGPVDLPPMSEGGYGPEWRPGIGIAMFTRLNFDEGLGGDDLDLFTRKSVDSLNAARQAWEHDNLLKGNMMSMLAEDFMTEDPKKVGGNIVMNLHGVLYAYIGRTDWLHGFNAEFCPPDNPYGVNDYTKKSMTEDRQLMAALWAITRTPVVQTVQAHIPRPVRRRTERKGYDPEVRILTLGGEHVPRSGPSPKYQREWRHQWIVSPHFVWQPYGPRAEGKRKLILRGPFKKGPEGAPLLGAERVWRIVPPKES